METQPIRVGIVGCGSVMQGAYMAQLERLRGRGLVEIVAAADHNESRRTLVEDEFRIGRFSTHARDVIDADDVDLVLVLTSIPAHAELATAALANGKHVLVEKPMATRLDEAARLVELAARGPGLLVCAPHVVLSPTYRALWSRVRRGDIGRVHLARARYGWAGPTWNEWFYTNGGGALFDMAMYSITSLTGLLGPVRRVVALAGVAIAERQVGGAALNVEAEDNAQLLLDFGEATYAVVTTGFASAGDVDLRRSSCIGPKARSRCSATTGRPRGWSRGARTCPHGAGTRVCDPAWPWTDGLRHLVDCIRTGARPVIEPSHAYHALDVVDQGWPSEPDRTRPGGREHLSATRAPGS